MTLLIDISEIKIEISDEGQASVAQRDDMLDNSGAEQRHKLLHTERE